MEIYHEKIFTASIRNMCTVSYSYQHSKIHNIRNRLNEHMPFYDCAHAFPVFYMFWAFDIFRIL